ncbi:RnaseH-domain-containing protein [Polyporus arcularius HHB13444]|uniref:ribonuclease H n=1 Tax=Polyporus arcularius HHB13444 TaxID=1314778 RepID=A0A5C3P777_9APHY|nr:RnaseH-domain-containing protein [Polyporus arcularius HHB13444]
MSEDGSTLTIATDGSCIHNGERNAQAGAGIFVTNAHVLNQSIRVPGTIDQTNQTGEIAATLLASTVTPPCSRVTQVTDSRTTMESLTSRRQRHEDTGYILQRNARLTKATIAKLRMRRGHTLFKWVKGHAGHEGNEAADKLAAEGATKQDVDRLDLTIPTLYRVTGAKLQAMTQKLAYNAIRKIKDSQCEPRPRAVANIDRITSGIQAAYNTQIHEATIWLSLRTKHVSRSASQFMWMAIHDGYMIGTHWLRPKMPADLQQRAYCAICGECETMSHIILECKAKGQELIWKLLKEVWSHTGENWVEPNWGTSFGAACASIRNPKGARKAAVENLWCILSSETTHLIWKLRCERVIQNEGTEFAEAEIINRFYAMLDSRLTLDRRTAARARGLGRKALKPYDVERIWQPIIEGSDELPPNWVVDYGVLVGIKRGR